MILATFGDIHGNAAALEAVLDEIDSQGILTIFHTGDCVVGGDKNGETLQILGDRAIPGALGEWDHRLLRYIRKRKTLEKKLDPDDLERLDAAYRQCSSGQLEYLNNLDRLVTSTIDGVSIAVCHGTVNSFQDVLGADAEDAVYARQRELHPAHVIVSGRTHETHERRIGDTLFVNPGAVGVHAGRAEYAIVSTEDDPWCVEFRVVEYSV